MSSLAKDKLADLVTLPLPVMREIIVSLQEAMEDREDAEDAERIRGEIERGESTLVPLEQVMKELGITDADLQD